MKGGMLNQGMKMISIGNPRPSQILSVLLLLAPLFIWAMESTPGPSETRPPVSVTQSANKGAERPELILQAGHSSKADATAFSPDGRSIATGGVDTSIKIWDAATGRVLRTLGGHAGGVKAIAISPNGLLLASGGNDSRIRIWEIASGKESDVLTGHTNSVSALAFSRDGKWLASGGADFKVGLWNLATRGSQVFDAHYRQIFAVAFSPDGAWLASGGADETINLWDLTKWLSKGSKKDRELSEPIPLLGHKGWIRDLAFSPNGKTLVSCGADERALLWQLPKGKLQRTLPKQSAPLLAAVFVADGAELLICAEDRSIKRFDSVTGDELETISDRANLARYEAVVFSADGRWLAASGGVREVELRRAAPGGETRALESRVNPINVAAFSPDSRWFATANQDGTVTLWDVVAGRAVTRLGAGPGRVRALAFSPDSQRLVSGSGEMITLWDVVAAREARKWNAHADGVTALVFTPDGKELISGSADATIKIWETASWQESIKLTEHKRGVTALDSSADGRWLVSAGSDHTLRLWDLPSHRATRVFNGHTGAVFAVAFSADGKLIASAGADKTVRVWDVSSGALIRTLNGHTGIVYSVAFTPDARWLAAGGGSGEIKVWETATGNQIFNLSGHAGSVNSLCFDASGRWLVSGSEDGSARVWGAGAGELAATLVSLRSNSRPASLDWLVVTPAGLFDGSAAAWGQILWRFGHNTYNVAPVELFFNEFYRPDLLAEALAGKLQPATVNISQRDRRQPRVKLSIEETNSIIAERTVTVKLEVSEAPSDKEHPAGSGAQDVRLFRNGSLVKVWRGDALAGRGAATFTHTLPIVAGENRLTAYAFNRDQIKSADETRIVIGAEGLRRKGTLYVIAVGVNQYANQDYNLRYAVKDAQSFGEALRRQQARLDRFSDTIIVTLLDRQATKSNLIAALKRLTAGSGATLPTGAPPVLERLQPAQPEDSVIVYYAGHGTARDARFYLIPHDLGYSGRREELSKEGMDEIIAHSISDETLETLFEGVDAGHLLFILDACNSGQALESEEQRRGPMNSRGLAQLAYEKGMNILAAAQGYQLAKEASRLEHGYLTFALIEEGINKLAADYKPKDGQVRLREWLDHATEAVPRLQEDKIRADGERSVRLRLAEPHQDVRESQIRMDVERGIKLKLFELQRPKVFYRREEVAHPLVIATQ
jgi:WD40 repeat protein